LAKLNASLKKLGKTTVSALPQIDLQESKKSLADIFSPLLRRTTLVVTAGYFLHIISFYFLAKWLPRIVSATFPTLPPGTGPYILALTNFGGAAGGILFGLLATKVGLKRLTMVILVCNAAAIAVFGRTPADQTTVMWVAIAVGFFGNAAISGMYSIAAYAFPTHVRATGTGFVIGVGRGGAVLSPILASFLFDPSNALKVVPIDRLSMVATVMAMGSLLSAVVLLMLKLNVDKPVVQETTQKASQLRTRTV
jgi:MFS family permease